MHSQVWEPLLGVYKKVFQVPFQKLAIMIIRKHYQNNLKIANKEKNKCFTANDYFLNYLNPRYLGFLIE